MSAIGKLRRMAVAQGRYFTEDFLTVMSAILELDDRSRAPAPLPEGWEIDEDDDACYRGEVLAYARCDRLVLVQRADTHPSIPIAVARALLERVAR